MIWQTSETDSGKAAIIQIQHDLHATASQISWTLSLFVLIQGVIPLLWSVMSELKGRKVTTLHSNFTGTDQLSCARRGCVHCFHPALRGRFNRRGALAVHRSAHWYAMYTSGRVSSSFYKFVVMSQTHRGLFNSSSAVLAIGAATLADIYDSHERGSKMGLYYSAPLLGPSIGPILGGGCVRKSEHAHRANCGIPNRLTQGFDWRACFWFLVIFGGLNLLSFTFLFKDTFRRERSLAYQRVLKRNLEENQRNEAQSRASSEKKPNAHVADSEAAEGQPTPAAFSDIKLSLKDVDPVMPMLRVLRRLNNPVILVASGEFEKCRCGLRDAEVPPAGFIYGFSYSILYTSARVLGAQYGYDALHTG